ncbi:MAG: S41 family peptidase [Chitinophagaceae bacterium]
MCLHYLSKTKGSVDGGCSPRSLAGNQFFPGPAKPFIFAILIPICLFIFSCRDAWKHTILDDKISVKDIRDDYTYFRLILEAVHPGLYLYVSQKEMNRRFDSVYNSLDKDLTLLDFYNRISPIINSIHCGHTSIYPPEVFADSVHKMKAYFPIPVNMVNERLLVNSTDFDIPLGAEIISVNKEKVSRFLPFLWNYEPVDGFNKRYQQEEGGWDFASNYFKYKGPHSSFWIGYKKDSSASIIETEIEAQTYGRALEGNRHFALPEDVNYDMELFDEDGYAILTIYTFGYDTWSTDKAFENFITNSFRLLKQSPKIRNLIIDLRNNTGGNFHNMFHLYGQVTHRQEWKEFKSAYTVFNRIPFTPYLAKGENDLAVLQASLDSNFSTKKDGRSVRQYTDNETMYPSDYRFGGNMVVLINSNVQSAAAYFAALVKDEGKSKIVGDETGGSGTNTNSFHLLTYELPHSKIQLTVPVVHAEFSLENNRIKAGHGVVPDYPVSISLANLIENTDTQLNFVLDSLLR